MIGRPAVRPRGRNCRQRWPIASSRHARRARLPMPPRHTGAMTLRCTMRILVIEDDRKVAGFIQTGLQQEGYGVDVLHEGTGAGDQANAVDYDALVLDLMLPGRSGFQVLRDVRARKASLPVLILTAKDTVDERVAGLDGGADDYMVKPFALAELS